MGTLASELAPVAAERPEPRVYADANIVQFMRERLGWDVFFVMEHEELRRARDIEHYRLARQLARTLITHDPDNEYERGFPPSESARDNRLSAPDDRLGLARVRHRPPARGERRSRRARRSHADVVTLGTSRRRNRLSG